jgi:tetratricopeptide (TPR) repeat protein
MGDLAIQLGYFNPGDPLTVVGQAHSAAVASIPEDTAYKYDVRYKDGTSIVAAGRAHLKYQFNKYEYNAATACRDRGNFAEAEKLLRDILLRTPDESAVLNELATILFTQRRYQEAESTYRSLQSQDPNSFMGPAGLGAVAEVSGRYQEAIRELSLAIQDSPTFALSYSWRARAYLSIGQFAQGKADLERVVELLPPQARIAVEARDVLTSMNRASVNQGSTPGPDGRAGVN